MSKQASERKVGLSAAQRRSVFVTDTGGRQARPRRRRACVASVRRSILSATDRSRAPSVVERRLVGDHERTREIDKVPDRRDAERVTSFDSSDGRTNERQSPPVCLSERIIVAGGSDDLRRTIQRGWLAGRQTGIQRRRGHGERGWWPSLITIHSVGRRERFPGTRRRSVNTGRRC